MRYQLSVATPLSERAVAAFPELHRVPAPSGGTRLVGEVRDPAQLAEIVARFGALGLDLVDIHRLPG